MNECGAFWGLMTGLVIGVIRMILDFAYQAPLCMEEDNRPAIVGQFHYMYFAALLFWITGIAAVVISLVTPPDDKYRVCHYLCVTFTILVSFSRGNALFASKAKVNVF